MTTYSSILAWEVPWTEEPGGLQSMGVTSVRHDLGSNPPPGMLFFSFSCNSLCFFGFPLRFPLDL